MLFSLLARLTEFMEVINAEHVCCAIHMKNGIAPDLICCLSNPILANILSLLPHARNINIYSKEKVNVNVAAAFSPTHPSQFLTDLNLLLFHLLPLASHTHCKLPVFPHRAFPSPSPLSTFFAHEPHSLSLLSPLLNARMILLSVLLSECTEQIVPVLHGLLWGTKGSPF